MKLTLNAPDFTDAVTWAIQAYDSKDTQSYAALTVDRNSGRASLVHANQVSHMRAPIAVSELEFNDDETEDSYSIPLDGAYLKNLAAVVKRMKIETLVASKKLNSKNDSLKIKGDRQNFTVPVLTLEVKKDPELITIGDANDLEFFSAIQRLAKLCTPVAADTGSATGSVAVKMGEKRLTIMATDSFSFGEVLMKYDPNLKAVEKFKKTASNGEVVLIPRAAALTVKPSKVTTDTVDFVYDPESQKFGYSFDDGRIALFSLDQALPIPYEGFKDAVIAQSTKSVDVPLVELTRAIESISLLSPEETQISIRIKGTKKGKITVSDSNSTNVIELEPTGIDFTGDMKMSFFREVIKNSLIPMASEIVRVHFAPEFEDGMPEVSFIRPLDDRGNPDKTVFSISVLEA